MDQLKDFIAPLLTFLAGLGSGWTLKMLFDRSKNRTTIRGNRIGGDVAGRDMHKK